MLILMREICRVTWRSLVYHILLIRNVFDIFCVKLKTFCRKLCMLSIKFNLAVPFSPFKLVQSLLHPLASWFYFLMFFFINLLLFYLFDISFICSQDVFDPVKCERWFWFCDCLSSLFIDTLLFCIVFHRQSFRSHHCHDSSHCLHLKALLPA